MKKTVQWIAAVLALGVFAVASAGSEPSPAPAPPASAATVTAGASVVTPASDEVISQSAGVETETTYYSDATKTVEVGFCIQRTCHPKGRTCSGTITAFRTITQSPC